MSAHAHGPLISVIVAVYNGGPTLQQCIDSVVSQTLQEVELIVIDGGSTDGTVDVLISNAAQLAYWVSESDKGIYNAWNKALRYAKGEWICFLGADDYLWSCDVLARMAEVLKTLPQEALVAHGQVMLLGRGGTLLYAIGAPDALRPRPGVSVMGLPPHPGLMHRRAVFENRGGFDESFRIAGDSELLLRELLLAPARFVPDVIVTGMRQGGISSRPENVLNSLQELRRIQRKHGIRWPGVALTLARLRAVLSWLLWCFMGEALTRRALDLGRKLMGKPTYWTRT